MSKKTLMTFGIILVLLGGAGLIPTWFLSLTVWYSIVLIILGIIGIAVAAMDDVE